TIFGTPIQDLLTNFPLATHFTTGLWLEVTSTAPDGRSDTYRRTIKDLIGPDLRMGGSAQLPPRDESPLLTTSDLIQVQPIANSAYPLVEANRTLFALYQQVPALVDTFNASQTLNNNPTDLDTITAFVDEKMPAVYEAQFAQLDLMNAMFQFGSTWDGRPMSAATLLVKSYPDRPKLTLSSQIMTDDGSLQTSFELLNIAEKAIAYPGQNSEAVQSANFLRTTTEKGMEYELLDLFLPDEVHSAVRTLIAADEQGIPSHFIVAENLAELDSLAIPDDTKAIIADYASTGALIAVPEQMVAMPYGEDIGFMVVAPDGNASYVNADGYMAAEGITYGIFNRTIALEALVQGFGLGFVGGFIAYIFNFFAEVFIAAITPITSFDGPGFVDAANGQIAGANGKSTILSLIIAAKAAIPLPIASCGASPNPGACQAGVMAGYGFVIAALVAGLAGGALDPSLTDFWVSDLPLPPPATTKPFTLTGVSTLPGPVNLN
ncbi:MAG: hypothetical protein KC413_23480, partial [Anaerolineales bacterium]|nr:hypothetical protein [Anaerolineales bacterium]